MYRVQVMSLTFKTPLHTKRPIRSTDQVLLDIAPTVIASRAFCFAAPRTWNSLPFDKVCYLHSYLLPAAQDICSTVPIINWLSTAPLSRCLSRGASVAVPQSRCLSRGASVAVPQSRCLCRGASVAVPLSLCLCRGASAAVLCRGPLPR